MSNKANAVASPTGGQLSAEQRARISQSFRAAKALLARKRPRSGDENEIKILSRVDGIKRLPLSEICTNMPSPAALYD